MRIIMTQSLKPHQTGILPLSAATWAGFIKCLKTTTTGLNYVQ